MSTARDLFLSIGWVIPGNEAAYKNLCKAAELWRADGHHFSAGIAMSRAAHAAWGHPDRMLEAQSTAINDFERFVAENTENSSRSLAALFKLSQPLESVMQLFEVDRPTIRTRIRELDSELAQRLLKHFRQSEYADNYLVRGFIIITDLDGAWDSKFPAYEVPLGTEQGGAELVLNIPSAFHHFVSDGDWEGAHQIIKARSSAFTSHGLRGWRSVTLANINPNEAVQRFDEAADSFAADAEPDAQEFIRRGGHWSGANQQLWTKYFRARARLVESIRAPERLLELLTDADKALAGTEFGWHSAEVSKFHVLIKVLVKLVSDPLSFSAEDARREYQQEISFSVKTEADNQALTFIHEAAASFRGFEIDPASEVTRNRLGHALEALAKVPNIGPGVMEAVRPKVGKHALTTILGPVRTWMHRGLEAIKDEAVLRRVLLRLLQSGLPAYAQVRHGPIEYGKDIVVLLEDEGQVVLRQYQAKCGDINATKWRECKDELEEIFLVPLSNFQLPARPERVEGILVTNGHANPFVEPVMAGWFKDQREHHGRQVKFIHLDRLVDFIAKHRLMNELRVALREEGIDLGEGGRA